MNKKAGIPDGIFYLVAMFAIAITSIVGFLIMDSINNNFQGSGSISSQGKTIMNTLSGKYVGIMDNAFLIIFVGILIGTGVGVWFIKTHPALFWIMIPIFAFIIFLSAIYANVFYNFINNAKVNAIMFDDAGNATFIIIPFIMQNYAYIITGVIIFLAILLFSKGKSEDI